MMFHRWLAAALWLALLTAFAALYVLGPPPPAEDISGIGVDKLLHTAGFLAVTLAAFLLRGTVRAAVLATMLMLVAAGVLEWAQSFQPGRETSLLDVAASLLGVVLAGAVMAAALMRRAKIRRRPTKDAAG